MKDSDKKCNGKNTSLLLGGRPRAEGAEQAPVERSADNGNFH